MVDLIDLSDPPYRSESKLVRSDGVRLADFDISGPILPGVSVDEDDEEEEVDDPADRAGATAAAADAEADRPPRGYGKIPERWWI